MSSLDIPITSSSSPTHRARSPQGSPDDADDLQRVRRRAGRRRPDQFSFFDVMPNWRADCLGLRRTTSARTLWTALQNYLSRLGTVGGSVFIPWMVFPQLSFLFWDWFRTVLVCSLYAVRNDSHPDHPARLAHVPLGWIQEPDYRFLQEALQSGYTDHFFKLANT